MIKFFQRYIYLITAAVCSIIYVIGFIFNLVAPKGLWVIIVECVFLDLVIRHYDKKEKEQEKKLLDNIKARTKSEDLDVNNGYYYGIYYFIGQEKHSEDIEKEFTNWVNINKPNILWDNEELFKQGFTLAYKDGLEIKGKD